nr:high-affinity choline transporter 1-like [Rhipicephalus microplus]
MEHDFTIAGYPHSYQLNDVDSPRVLPFTIVYLTSGMTAIFGLVSIAAAVMSSADSSMLSASTMITRNVYQALIRPAATEMEVVITLRIMICALGSLSVYMALSVNSVFDLWTLCSDIVYVLLFPQLLCVFYFKETNAYGSVLAFIVGGVFRCLCGEPSMNIPVLVRLPLYDPVAGQRFPFRLLCMALGLCTLLLGSFAATTVFRRGLLPEHFDVFHCFVKRPPMSQLRVDQTTGTCMAGIDHTATAQHAVSRRGSTTDVAVTEKEVPLGISKDDHKSSLVVPFQARDDGGGGHTNRQSCLAPHKRRSDESEVHRNARLVASGFTGAIVPSSRVLETSPAEDAMAERKTLHKTSMSGGAKGGCKATHKKSVAGGSEGLTDGGVSRL